jgi:hemerythrin-like domain-containing protein
LLFNHRVIFDDRNGPLEKLTSAHRRLEENLNDLARAARALSEARRREDSIEVISSVIAYFERSVNRHEEDEERSLFPRLLVLESIAPTITRLRQEHDLHRREVDELREAIARDGGDEIAQAMPQLVESLRVSYDRHIACEEREVFPAARRFLQPSALQAILTEMEARRGRSGSGARIVGGGRGSRGTTRRGP